MTGVPIRGESLDTGTQRGKKPCEDMGENTSTYKPRRKATEETNPLHLDLGLLDSWTVRK